MPLETRAEPSTETVEEALCRLIETASRNHAVPQGFLTRLIWRESSFRTGVVSPAGAQGIAQFMPGTALERQLADPFDPEQAIPKAAEFIAELNVRFGNLGLAAAAYNGGPARVAAWLAGRGGLPAETQSYVYAVTGRPAADWAGEARDSALAEAAAPDTAVETCVQIVAGLRRPRDDGPGEAPFAPWGVQLAGNFSKAQALASFGRSSSRYASVLGEVRPMVIGTRLRSRGTRTFYRVRVPAESRSAANALCLRIRSVGGSCVALPS
ncbi:MAG: lytic transglycosylase domain-containing protein [Microvirga sp.]